MTLRILHLSDLHIGARGDVTQLDAIERQLPGLGVDVIVLSGDLTQRARHGEFVAAHFFIKRLEQTVPALVIPGNHDVEWWWRPFIPFATSAKYRKYRRYFGVDLTPTIRLPEAVIASVLTAHGVAWGSLTPNPRDIGTKGHLPKGEIRRAAGAFGDAPAGAAKVLVLHHNVLRGELSERMGLSRWRQAGRAIAESGAELVLCGHDHQEAVGTLAGKAVVSTSGTVSTRMRKDRPPVFNVIDIAPDQFQITYHRWEAGSQRFRASDVHAFARHVTYVYPEPATTTSSSG